MATITPPAPARPHRLWLPLAIIAAIGARPATRRPALRPAGRLQPRRSRHHGRALGFAKGSLNPHNFLYPTFYFYVLFAWVGAYLAFVCLSGRVGSIAELQRLYFTDPSGLYTAGRALGAAAGSATPLLLYRLTERLAGRRAGIAAALFLATAPLARSRLALREARRLRDDAGGCRLSRDGAGLARRRVPRVRGARDVAAAGAACGAAFSTHYYCVFLALPLAWCIVQAGRRDGWGRVLRELALAGAVRARPSSSRCRRSSLADPATAWRDITANRAIVVDRAVAAGAFAPAVRYLDILIARFDGGAGRRCSPLVGVIWMLVAAPAPGRSAAGLPRSVPRVHQQHRAGKPLSESGSAVPGWLRRVGARRSGEPASLPAVDVLDRAGGVCAARGAGQRAHRPLLPSGRHPHPGAASTLNAPSRRGPPCSSSPTRRRSTRRATG